MTRYIIYERLDVLGEFFSIDSCVPKTIYLRGLVAFTSCVVNINTSKARRSCQGREKFEDKARTQVEYIKDSQRKISSILKINFLQVTYSNTRSS